MGDVALMGQRPEAQDKLFYRAMSRSLLNV